MLFYEMLSSPGERERNEDYVGMERNADGAYCFVLADGLGGHRGGDKASSLVSEFILQDFVKKGEVSVPYLQNCFEESQRLLLEGQKEQDDVADMKTTLVVLLADGKQVCWGHIGDSRLYYFAGKKLKMQTLDHSVPQALVSAGELKAAKIRGHIDRNRLLYVLGAEWSQPCYELFGPMPCTGGDAFLLCTDGFWEWIKEKSMQSALKRAKSPKEWLLRMEKTVQKHGAGKNMDNYSAAAVFWMEKE